jgi:hypothetical protein
MRHASLESLEDPGCTVNLPQLGDNTGGWGRVSATAARKRAGGSIAYKAGLVVRKDGKQHRPWQIVDREAAGRDWMKRRIEKLRKPGGLSKLERTWAVTLAYAIERFTTGLTQIGRTKAKALQALLLHDVARKKCQDIGWKHLVDVARDPGLDRKPQKVANCMSQLSAVVAIAKPAWAMT